MELNKISMAVFNIYIFSVDSDTDIFFCIVYPFNDTDQTPISRIVFVSNDF